ncbi:MAG: hypothetical protein GY856_52045, partial [bacterium]|nr:hypothetical protein [bacterium]
FEKADPRTQLGLMRRNAERDAELASRMSKVLVQAAGQVVDEDPGLACEIWFGLDKYGLVDRDVPWSPAALVAPTAPGSAINELLPLFAGIRDRAQRERAYVIARESREDWRELYVRLLWQENEARALDRLADGLIETAGELFRGFFDQLLSQPRKNPGAFTWLAERAAGRAEWLKRNPLRLLKQILWSLTSESFAACRSRLEPLCESGGTLPRLLDHLTPEQAAQAAEAIEKTTGLVDYQRNPLLNALYLRFPELRREAEAPLYATPEAIAAKREQLRHLLEVEIPANRRAIEEARELGDLSENFEYKSARERHEYLSARATAIDHDLRRARPIGTPVLDGHQVVIGCRIRCESTAGQTRTITILGPWDSSPREDILSNESDLAQKLLGRKVGDDVELAGERFAIVAIEPFR